jgi:signal transduction histidine kinase
MLTATNPATAVGTRSDLRATFAGTRTFLAWNRPTFVLIAAGAVVAALLKLTFEGVPLIAALSLVALAASTSLSSYRLWQRSKRAARSNAHARLEVRRLTEEQAALRRVVTLIARETSPQEVFAALVEVLGQLLSAGDTSMVHYEPDGTVRVVASWGECKAGSPVVARLIVGGQDIASLVRRTGRPVRIGDSAVGTPIAVEGRLWGAMVAASRQAEPLPADTESRVEEFTELVAAAISNVEARSELAASRARIVAAADAERRRVTRDLHDGAQQRLVYTVVTLKLARQALESEEQTAPALIAEALEHARHATDELRELSHGVLPAALTRGGLHPGVESLASRMSVPVEIEISVGRLPSRIEAAAYFFVAEALTNVVKHASATGATVGARIEDETLRVTVRDDGVGGARPNGSGLLGLADRLATLDGRLRVQSPPERGTLVVADIPLGTEPRIPDDDAELAQRGVPMHANDRPSGNRNELDAITGGPRVLHAEQDGALVEGGVRR